MKRDMTWSQRQRSEEMARACLQAWVNANPGIIEYRECVNNYFEWRIMVGHKDGHIAVVSKEFREPSRIGGLSMGKAPAFWREHIKSLVESAYAEAKDIARFHDSEHLPELVYPY